MKTTRMLAASAALALTFGLAACGSDDDDDIPVGAPVQAGATSTPDAGTASDVPGDDDDVSDTDLRAQLEQIALEKVGSGRVTDVERSDDRDHAYEVEVDLGNDEDVSVEIADDLSVVRVDR